MKDSGFARLLAVAFQLAIFGLFLVFYIAAIIPTAVIVAMRRPIIKPGRRVKTTIGLKQDRRIY